jgi:hypothetical protein
MSVEALVAHRLPGRLRLRLPLMRGDAAFFEQLRADIGARLTDVLVRVNARSASVLVTGPESSVARIEALAREQAWFDVVDGYGGLYGSMPASMPGDAGHRPALIALLLALAAVQILRGQIMVPAATLLWYAYAVDAGFFAPDSD